MTNIQKYTKNSYGKRVINGTEKQAKIQKAIHKSNYYKDQKTHFYVSANLRNGLALSKMGGSAKSRAILLYLYCWR